MRLEHEAQCIPLTPVRISFIEGAGISIYLPFTTTCTVHKTG
jgi:hypothetical protein